MIQLWPETWMRFVVVSSKARLGTAKNAVQDDALRIAIIKGQWSV